MDPNAALEEIRRIVLAIHANTDSENLHEIGRMSVRLADLVEGLDKWLAAGGFLPNVWKRLQ